MLVVGTTMLRERPEPPKSPPLAEGSGPPGGSGLRRAERAGGPFMFRRAGRGGKVAACVLNDPSLLDVLKDDVFDSAEVNETNGEHTSNDEFADKPFVYRHLSRVLRESATLVLRTRNSDAALDGLKKAGFIESQVSGDQKGSFVRCVKPKAGVQDDGGKPRIQRGNVWKLADDELDDDEGLIDEDRLIQSALNTYVERDTKINRTNPSKPRRACKNCVCGRKNDAKPAKTFLETGEPIVAPKGGCGSCSLGDAFRCAGCPYRGLPAFIVNDTTGAVTLET